MNAKVSAKTGTTLGGSAAGGVVIVWLLSLFGIEVAGEVGAAIAAIIAGAVAYFMPARSGKYVVTEPIGDLDPGDAVEDPLAEDPEPDEVEEGDLDHVDFELVEEEQDEEADA